MPLTYLTQVLSCTIPICGRDVVLMVLDWVAGLQVVDWSEGGRTEAAHVKRIFSREHSSGPHQVSALMRRSASASHTSACSTATCGHHRHGFVLRHIGQSCQQLVAATDDLVSTEGGGFSMHREDIGRKSLVCCAPIAWHCIEKSCWFTQGSWLGTVAKLQYLLEDLPGHLVYECSR